MVNDGALSIRNAIFDKNSIFCKNGIYETINH